MYFLPLRVIRCPVVLFASFSAMLESLVLRFFRFPHAPIPVFHPRFVSISYSRFSGTSKEFHKRKLKFIEKQLITLIHAKMRHILDTSPCKMTSLETHCSRIFSNFSFAEKVKKCVKIEFLDKTWILKEYKRMSDTSGEAFISVAFVLWWYWHQTSTKAYTVSFKGLKIVLKHKNNCIYSVVSSVIM